MKKLTYGSKLTNQWLIELEIRIELLELKFGIMYARKQFRYGRFVPIVKSKEELKMFELEGRIKRVEKHRRKDQSQKDRKRHQESIGM